MEETKNYFENLMVKYQSWGELVKNLIIERLEDYKNCESYVADLSDLLFESENINGSFTCSYYWSRELIKKYWEDFADLVNEWNLSTGENLNPFESEEKFIVIMLLEQSRNLLSNYKNDFINDNWNNKIILNYENIKKIVESMEE